MTERDIFIATLQKEDPAQRQAYLDVACSGLPRRPRQIWIPPRPTRSSIQYSLLDRGRSGELFIQFQ